MGATPSKSDRDSDPPSLIQHGKALRRYVHEGGIPSSCTTSNFGVMCERMEIMGVAEIECPACRSRARRRAHRRVAEALPVARQEALDDLFEGLGWSRGAARGLVYYLEDTDCPRCDGMGRIVTRITQTMRENPEIDTVPMGSTKSGRPPDTVADTDELERMGQVGNLLARMAERDPEAAAALQIWRSPGGGSYLCLLGMTKPGRILLEEAPEDQEPAAFFESEQRRRDGGYTDHHRDKLYTRAESEARLLLESAIGLWNELVQALEAKRRERKRSQCRAEARNELERYRRARTAGT